jgi:GH24 family phage-related lysozyme (muramidase)
MIVSALFARYKILAPRFDHVTEAKALVRPMIKKYEKISLTPYPDGKGMAICYGHQLDIEKIAVTLEECERLLTVDIEYSADAVLDLVTVDLTVEQMAALIDFVYNLGRGSLARSTLLKHLNAGKYDLAGDELLRWTKINVDGEMVDSPLLVERRAEEKALWDL